MKKEKEEKQFLGGMSIGLVLGIMIGYFVFNFVHAVAKADVQPTGLKSNNTTDWSKHHNKDKRDYLEGMYNISSKN